MAKRWRQEKNNNRAMKFVRCIRYNKYAADFFESKMIVVTPERAWKKIIGTILLFVLALLAGIGLGMLHRQFSVDAADTVSGQEDEQVKKVALTFDDGPNPIYTEPLLDGLKERQVSVTFFVLGEEAEQYPEILRRASEEGHLIGVHSYEHVNLRNLTDEEALAQVNRANQVICEITGQSASLIRPPYGCWKEDLEEESRLIQVLWDVDPLDWATTSSDLVVQRVLKSVEENSIILLHDASASSVQAAFTIIDTLQAQGYTFVTVNDILFD
jgi:peptidoglycan/xylan/chitin deacetylase (PgdA/CDA1 family)